MMLFRRLVLFAVLLVAGSGSAQQNFSPEGRAGWRLLSSKEYANVNNVVYTDLGTVYRRFRFEFDLFPSTTDIQWQVETDENNGASFDTSGYRYVTASLSEATGLTRTVSGAAASLILTEATAAWGSDPTNGFTGTFVVESPGSAAAGTAALFSWTTSYLSAGAQGVISARGAGVKTAAARINAIRISPESGTVVKASVRVYGELSDPAAGYP